MVIIGEMTWPRSQFDKRVGKFLATARRDAGYTQEAAASEIGVITDTLAKWEMGVRRPGLEKLRKAARLYGVSVGFFVD